MHRKVVLVNNDCLRVYYYFAVNYSSHVISGNKDCMAGDKCQYSTQRTSSNNSYEISNKREPPTNIFR